MGFLSNFFRIDDDTKQVLRELYLQTTYTAELEYAERCAEEAQDSKYDEEDRQTLRSESRGGYTEAYHAKQEIAELGREIEEGEESSPWWKIW